MLGIDRRVRDAAGARLGRHGRFIALRPWTRGSRRLAVVAPEQPARGRSPLGDVPGPSKRVYVDFVGTEPDYEATRRWLALLPSASDSARAEVEPFDALQRDAGRVLAGRLPLDDPADADGWQRWRDPSDGRPR